MNRLPSRLLLALLLGASLQAQGAGDAASKFYDDAQQRLEKKDIEGALIQLRNSLQADPRMLSAHLLLARTLLKVGDLASAEAAFDEALKQGVSRSEVMVDLGQLYIALGEYKKLLERVNTNGVPVGSHAEILTLRGTAFATLGQKEAASKSFAEARALAPRSPLPLLAEATMLTRQGDLEKARAQISKALEFDPANSAAWYALGTVQQRLKDGSGALASFGKALQHQPLNVDARVARAGLYVTGNQLKEAEQDLVALEQASLADARASYLRGVLETRKGNAAKARDAYIQSTELLALQPAGVINSDESLNFAGAMAYKALGDNEKAREHLRNLLALNANHYAGQLMAASIALEQRDPVQAQQVVSNLLRLRPNDPQVLYLQGSIHLARKRYDLAAETFDKAASLQPTPDTIRELALSQLSLGQGDAGISNLEKVLAVNPGDTRAAIQLITAYASMGKGSRALQLAENLLKSDPQNPMLINYLGNIKGRLGDKGGARASFQQALAKSPGFKPALINLSWLDIEEKQFDVARQRIDGLLKKDAEDPQLLYQLGVLELRARRFNEAVEALEKASNLSRNDPRPGLSLMELYTSQRKMDQAIAVGKGLNGKYQGNLEVALTLGRAYAMHGDMSNARTLLQEATRIAGYDPEAQVIVGRQQLAIGNVDGAGYNLQKAQQNGAEALNVLVLSIEVANRKKDNARADATLKTLLAKYPNAMPALLTAGHLAYARGQFAEAAKRYQQVLDLEPTSGNALLLARAQTSGGDPQKGLATLEAWSQKSPQDLGLLRVLAEAQAELGKNDAAKRSFSTLITRDPQDVSAMATYALLLQRLGDAGALAMAERARKLAPESPETLDAQGWIHVKRGEIEAGLRLLRDARLRDPNQGVLRFHLAYALAKSGRKPDAKEELQAALSMPGRFRDSSDFKALKAELGL
ncbi:PEP-CTERM system TPR-repeat protein PrsT [Pelomonas sp. APW6]|uniref:PEP-CTERM system TPR-repeat protein PrsT n=1 Tax=Roseateles subflavus TaxID=3053353 RepID=A0ABT7LPM0_9BURK|nr:XrtA/PEP-CTERM system TPR-repeat protein PrsT [Pelomonas sp. APW6]MDL5034182.1 PEP-CTERM system TPR-repeat protein PrsT [Pelomonas sp. APW6]